MGEKKLEETRSGSIENILDQELSQSEYIFLHSLVKTKNSSEKDKILSSLFLDTGCVQAFVAENGKSIYKFGGFFLATRDLIAAYSQGKDRIQRDLLIKLREVSVLGENLGLYVYQTDVEQRNYLFLFLMPGGKELAIDRVLPISNYFYHYYSNCEIENQADFNNRFQQIDDTIKYYLQKQQSGMTSIGILYLQDLSSYLSITGPFKSFEIYEKITRQVEKFLKNQSVVFMLNRRVILVLFPGMDKIHARTCLEDMFINVNDLIIDYNLYILEITGDQETRSIWEKVHEIEMD